jgi:hypothetical protein
MPATPAPSPLAAVNRLVLIISVLVLGVMMALLAGRTGEPGDDRAFDLMVVLPGAALWAGLWLVAAMGYGWPLRRWLLPESRDGLLIQAALGVAALMTQDAALGALGLLFLGGSAGTWLLTAIGWALLLVQVLRHRSAWRGEIRFPLPHWLSITAVPCLAVLLVATASAPGWLWETEFGGYDALSYHLPLAQEWIGLGRITGQAHNVYSFLPGYVEAAYTHLALLNGDRIEFAYAAQLLHALIMMFGALLVGRICLRLTQSPLAQVAGAVLVLATPWTLVTGSLAYNEMVVVCMLAASLLILLNAHAFSARSSAAIGLLCAAACGAKLTSLGFVVLPVGLLILIRMLRNQPAKTLNIVLAGSLAGIAVLLPYLLRNGIQTGNPLFPLAGGMLGTGHWTAEQAAIFARGHRFDGSVLARIAAGFRELMLYGFNPAAPAAEQGNIQWSILPWLSLVGAGLALGVKSTRSHALRLLWLIIAMIAFWLLATHIKSRFILPAAVPMALLVTMGGHALHALILHRLPRAIVVASLAISLLALACVPVYVFQRQRDAKPALFINATHLATGDGLPREEVNALAGLFTSVYARHRLPDDATLYLIGEARPFYYPDDAIYHTTWDRGLISQIIADNPDQSQHWPDALLDAGITHVVLDADMLARWRDAGWADPNIDPDLLFSTLTTHGRVVSQSGPRLVLIELRRSTRSYSGSAK